MFNFPTPQSVMGIIVSQNDKLSSFRLGYTAPEKVSYPLVFPSLLICTATSDTSTTLGNANQNKTPSPQAYFI